MAKTSTYKGFLAAGAALAIVMAASPAQAQQRSFNLPAQSATRSIPEFGRQAGIQIIAPGSILRSVRTPALRGNYDVRAALRTLLAGSGLRIVSDEGRTITLGASRAIPASTEAGANGAAVDIESADSGATPEILVVGQRSLNADIRRTENDAQPWVVFGQEEITRSQANTIEEFLGQRLPMNTQSVTSSQLAGVGTGSQSGFNLRGLGTSQTLILVDGRRVPGVASTIFGTGNLYQPDINGIPLESIERIEVLPSTAGGIYGGGATGGAINIITRRDYRGVSVRLNYSTPLNTSAQNSRVDVSGGFDVLGFQVIASLSHSWATPLLVGDRNFAERGRALLFANNPSAILNLALTAGAPPIGRTSNISSADGSDLVLDNGTSLRSAITFVPDGYRGAASDGGVALIANAGRYNLALPNDLFGARQSLLNDPTTSAATVGLRRNVGDRLNLFADLAWQSNKGNSLVYSGIVPRQTILQANAPNNPFNSAIIVSFPSTGLTDTFRTKSETIRALIGGVLRLPGSWVLSAEQSWSWSRYSFVRTSPLLGDPDGIGPGISANAAYRTGALDVTRDLNSFPLNYDPYRFPTGNSIYGPGDTTLWDASIRISGPVLNLPGGAITTSGLFEHREERVKPAFLISQFPLYFPQRSQAVDSFYVEGRAPIFSDHNSSPGFRSLELQAAARYDSYETRSVPVSGISVASPSGPLPSVTQSTNRISAITYTVGIRYSPIRDVIIRGSFATGFLPPATGQIVANAPANTSFGLVDPKRGGVLQFTDFSIIQGGNPNLSEERSRSWSAGLVVSPSGVPGLRLSVDYTQIDKSNEIGNLGIQDIVNSEDALPGRVVRGPLSAADVARGYTGGPITILNSSLVNFARTRVRAVDLQVDYDVDVGSVGRFHFYSVATWQPTFARQLLPSAPSLNLVGTLSGGPLEWKANLGVDWSRGPLSIGWNMQFYDSYRPYFASDTDSARALAVLSQGSNSIRSQAYNDIYIKYRFEPGTGMVVLRGTEILLGVRNIFNSDPPIIATIDPSGGYSTFGDPRLRRFSLSLRKSF